MILERLFGAVPAARDPSDERWWSGLDPMSAAGMPVTDETSMKVSTVFAALRVLAWSLASVPLVTYRRLEEDDARERARELPLYRILGRRPNRWQTSFQWRSLGMVHAMMRGNFYSRILPGPAGAVDQLKPLHPDYVSVVDQLPDGRLVYLHTPANRPEERLTTDDVLHIPGLSFDGKQGISVIQAMKESVGLALATERFGATMFGKRPQIAGVLKTAGTLDPKVATRVAESFRSAHSGPQNWHKVAVLEQGLEFQPTGMKADEAEFIATRDFQISEFLRFLGVPGVMVGYADKTATYASAEQFFLSFVTYSVGGWAVNWEQKFDTELLLEDQQDTYFVSFILDGLKRGDLKTRFEAYERAIKNRFLLPNEARRMENWNPIEGGDAFPPATTSTPTPPREDAGRDREQHSIRARAIATAAAARVVRKEVEAISARRSTVTEAPEQLEAFLTKFYTAHQKLVQQVLCVSGTEAWAYVAQQREAVLADPECVKTWETTLVPTLAARALGEDTDADDTEAA